jgi:pilus assembly protein CpaE
MTAPGTISVLLVHPYQETVRFISTLLTFERDINLVATCATGEEALRKVNELNPNVVLLASELPDMDSTKVIWQIASKALRTGVIVISTNESPEFLRRCMQAGARFFLVMPFNTEQLVNSIRDVTARMESERVARTKMLQTAPTTGSLRTQPQAVETGPKTIAFFGPKGGVGKTTCAVNVAVGLRLKTGANVALVDADFSFGDLPLLLNVKAEHSIIDFVEHIGDADADYVRSIMERHDTGIRLLPGPPQPEHAELIRSEHLKPLIAHLKRAHDYIILDCSPSYDDRMLTLLDAADLIMVVTTPEVGPLRNTAHFLALAQALGYPRDKIRIVLNRFNSDVGISPEDAAASLGYPISLRVPSGGRQMALAGNMGQPYVVQNGTTETGRAIYQIVDVIAGKSPVGAG